MLGLKNFFEDHKGQQLRFWLRDFKWELTYAWQRTWRGYDDVMVFNLDSRLEKTMVALLTDFKEHNNSQFGKLTEEETNRIIDRMIYCFKRCDESVVYKDFGINYEDHNTKDMIRVMSAVKAYKQEAYDLLAKWHDHLWI